MYRPVKQVVKQLVPPALLSLKNALAARWRRSSEGAEQRALRQEFERMNQHMRGDEICMRSGLTVKLHPESRIAFEAFCYTYPEMVAEMNCFMKLTEGKHNFLDVGALHGVFSIVFSTSGPAKKSVAVDASPIAFARLLYNVHKNRLSSVTPVECALSAEHGVLRMHYEWEHAVAAGTTPENSACVCVEKKTGDNLCAELRFDPDVIKIDVEGHEVKVLKGLRATIESKRPLIFLEVHPDRVRQEGDRLEDVETMFTDLNYRVESVVGDPLAMRMISAATADQRVVLHPSGAHRPVRQGD
jgi:FkbM family methyltransferase